MELEYARGEIIRLGHEPDPHLRHDAVVRLTEEAFEVGPDAPLVGVPGLETLERSTASTNERTVWKHRLDAAQIAEVIAVVGLANPAFQSIPHDAGVGRTVRAVQ